MTACALSWGSPATGWTFCVRERGHAGSCHGFNGPKSETVLFFHEQSLAQAEIDKAILEDRKREEKKTK